MSKRAQLKSVYLYPDNHAVAIFSEKHAESGDEVRWVEVYERWVESGYISGLCEGRVWLAPALAKALRKAKCIQLHKFNETPGARKLGIRISTLEVSLKDGGFETHDIPDLIAGDFRFTAFADLPNGEEAQPTEFAVSAASTKLRGLRVGKVHKYEPKGQRVTT